jgi:uncharacterized protein
MKKKDMKFLQRHELARLATASKKGMPHVTPVIYAMNGEDIVIATDYGTKKLKNLKENRQVSLVVDDHNPNRGVVIQGKCLVLERGSEYIRLMRILYRKFEYYRKNPWKEGEAPILKIKPTKTVGWGT